VRPSALFANHRETNLASTLALVEEVLREQGHDPGGSRTTVEGAPHAWEIRTGSAVTRVTVFPTPDFTHLRVRSVVMTLDPRVDRMALFQHLLERNAELWGAAFALEQNHVVLVSERSTLDLDRSEVAEMIRRVTTYADDHDDALVARFGGHMGER
jgi:hypothetical protein